MHFTMLINRFIFKTYIAKNMMRNIMEWDCIHAFAKFRKVGAVTDGLNDYGYFT